MGLRECPGMPYHNRCSSLELCSALQVTAISDSEEEAMGRADLVPFLLEDRIREVRPVLASVSFPFATESHDRVAQCCHGKVVHFMYLLDTAAAQHQKPPPCIVPK